VRMHWRNSRRRTIPAGKLASMARRRRSIRRQAPDWSASRWRPGNTR